MRKPRQVTRGRRGAAHGQLAATRLRPIGDVRPARRIVARRHAGTTVRSRDSRIRPSTRSSTPTVATEARWTASATTADVLGSASTSDSSVDQAERRALRVGERGAVVNARVGRDGTARGLAAPRVTVVWPKSRHRNQRAHGARGGALADGRERHRPLDRQPSARRRACARTVLDRQLPGREPRIRSLGSHLKNAGPGPLLDPPRVLTHGRLRDRRRGADGSPARSAGCLTVLARRPGRADPMTGPARRPRQRRLNVEMSPVTPIGDRCVLCRTRPVWHGRSSGLCSACWRIACAFGGRPEPRAFDDFDALVDAGAAHAAESPEFERALLDWLS